MRSILLRSLCLALALITLAAGCAKRPSSAAAAARTQTLLVGNGSEPADLDPPVATAATDMNIIVALFEGLTFIDEQSMQPVPAAAERWETSLDGLTWTFHLRANGAWSNGEPVTADDFVQSFRRAVSPKMALENASYLFALKNAEAINAGKIEDPTQLGCAARDAHTLVLTLERPTPHLALLTALTPWYPVNPRVLATFDALRSRGTAWTRPGHLVGNGPFQLESWEPNARLVVTKNPHYWDAAHTRLERVVFFPIEQPDAEERAFRAGQLHVTHSLPVARIGAWRKEDPARLRTDPLLQTVFIAFNTKRAPFSDPRVRQAFALAIDRGAISKSALAGAYGPAFSATPPRTGGYTADARTAFDPERARALLAAAGHARGAGLPPLTLQVRNEELQPLVAEALQAMWQQTLGVQVSIAPMEQKSWLDNQRTLNYSLSTFSWIADFPDPLTFLGVFTSDNGNNWTGWANPAYDRLVAAGAATTDPAPRNTHFQQAEALLLREAPLTPVFHGAQTYLLAPVVHGWVTAPLGLRRYQHLWLEEPAAKP